MGGAAFFSASLLRGQFFGERRGRATRGACCCCDNFRGMHWWQPLTVEIKRTAPASRLNFYRYAVARPSKTQTHFWFKLSQNRASKPPAVLGRGGCGHRHKKKRGKKHKRRMYGTCGNDETILCFEFALFSLLPELIFPVFHNIIWRVSWYVIND